MYRIIRKREVSVESRRLREENHGAWDLDLRRNLKDEESSEAAEVLDIIDDVLLIEGKEDSWYWAEEQSMVFSCKSYFQKLLKRESVSTFTAGKLIWKSKSPSKVKFLAWLVALNKVNSVDNFQKRWQGNSLNSQWSALCRQNEETTDHIFIHFFYTKEVWCRCWGNMP